MKRGWAKQRGVTCVVGWHTCKVRWGLARYNRQSWLNFLGSSRKASLSASGRSFRCFWIASSNAGLTSDSLTEMTPWATGAGCAREEFDVVSGMPGVCSGGVGAPSLRKCLNRMSRFLMLNGLRLTRCGMVKDVRIDKGTHYQGLYHHQPLMRLKSVKRNSRNRTDYSFPGTKCIRYRKWFDWRHVISCYGEDRADMLGRACDTKGWRPWKRSVSFEFRQNLETPKSLNF